MAVTGTLNCQAAEGLLGAWCDGELKVEQAEQVKRHLAVCPSCRSRRVQLERLDNTIRAVLQRKAQEVRFDLAWAGIEQRMAEKRSWAARFAERARLAFEMKRLRWAVSVAAVLLIGILALPDSYKAWLFDPGGGRTRIDSIDPHGRNVAVFRERETRTTVIWLFPDEEWDDEVKEESVSNNHVL